MTVMMPVASNRNSLPTSATAGAMAVDVVGVGTVCGVVQSPGGPWDPVDPVAQ